ncbi:LysR substrate-binding domain-containing protein [Mesorhizobium sp. YR577]|uniref:LysR substrate-binding domain-containing protein n=1 Tax=Mesorhizobium sp. YR577 TaxID=1884373 RepID=UPI0008EBB4F7|nr:LysR substrate-binding domain-containing protein [Mesorhizobium sp. YR577]SFU17156.1 LysR family transcriptional regulator, regulatory protein for tcuABC [Mesorhizobium sp. YR577]
MTYADIARLPFILPSSSHGLRELLEREAASHSISLDSVIEVDSYGNIKGLVEAGVGYLILPFNAIVQEVNNGQLQAWNIAKPGLKRAVHLVRPADRPITKAVLSVEALCHEILLDLAGSGKWNSARPI